MFIFNPTEEGLDLYIRYLVAVAQLSNLYSDNTAPYLEYRAAENIFCKAFSAENLARSDTAFDAKMGTLGIGIKTFVCQRKIKTEKIAEFNALSKELRNLQGKELAQAIAKYRNQRIESAYSTYALDKSVYHLITRRDGKLLIFEDSYECINLENIKVTKENDKAIEFNDGSGLYSFNFSKSVLFKRFSLPKNIEKILEIPVSILEDPYTFLLGNMNSVTTSSFINSNVKQLKPSKDYIVLPLYIPQDKKGKREKRVPDSSGLNLWNAKGRPRDAGEIELRLNSTLRNTYKDQNFFPPKDQIFFLKTPDGKEMRAKICQEGSKALMTNPNKDISTWLLRTVLQLQEKELLTYEHLEALGIDSVIITKVDDDNYLIDKAVIGSYEEYLDDCDVEQANEGT